jgi:hypothetical protein
MYVCMYVCICKGRAHRPLHRNLLLPHLLIHIARNVVFFEDSTSVDDTKKNAHIDSDVPL